MMGSGSGSGRRKNEPRCQDLGPGWEDGQGLGVGMGLRVWVLTVSYSWLGPGGDRWPGTGSCRWRRQIPGGGGQDPNLGPPGRRWG